MTARLVSDVLAVMFDHPFGSAFRASLAQGGEEGTLHQRLGEVSGQVWAKTGYISGVKALSGVCTTPKGDYLFSILTNGANGNTRKAINDIAKAIIDNTN